MAAVVPQAVTITLLAYDDSILGKVVKMKIDKVDAAAPAAAAAGTETGTEWSLLTKPDKLSLLKETTISQAVTSNSQKIEDFIGLFNTYYSNNPYKRGYGDTKLSDKTLTTEDAIKLLRSKLANKDVKSELKPKIIDLIGLLNKYNDDNAKSKSLNWQSQEDAKTGDIYSRLYDEIMGTKISTLDSLKPDVLKKKITDSMPNEFINAQQQKTITTLIDVTTDSSSLSRIFENFTKMNVNRGIRNRSFSSKVPYLDNGTYVTLVGYFNAKPKQLEDNKLREFLLTGTYKGGSKNHTQKKHKRAHNKTVSNRI